jgi:colanic acid biosynthesis glycosyl transferase WcaI
VSSFLFINQYYWPDEAATAQLLRDLAEDLVRGGHEVCVLCGSGGYACREKLEPGVFEHQGVRIERVGGSDLGRYDWKSRIKDGISFMYAAWRRMQSMKRYDVVVAMSSPPLVGELGIRFRRKHKVPMVLWAQDLYPEVAERLGALKNPLLISLIHRRARRIYAESSAIVVPGDDMSGILNQREEAAGKLEVIPNWADLNEIFCGPVLENQFRTDHGWGRDRVLMYSGNMGTAHDLEEMLNLVSLLQAQLSSMRFVLVGDSPRHEVFAERARSMKITRMLRFSFQPRESLGSVLGAADAHLVSQRSKIDGLLVPSKFYGAVAAGRPVIFVGSKDSELGRRITESQLGTVVEPGQAAGGVHRAKKTLLQAQDEPGTIHFIRDWAERFGSRSMRTQQFQDLLVRVAAC